MIFVLEDGIEVNKMTYRTIFGNPLSGMAVRWLASPGPHSPKVD